MSETRRHFSAEQKMAALRRHLLEHVPVSDVCDEYGINPTVFYRWQDESTRLASSLRVRECTRGAALFESRPRTEDSTSARQVAALECGPLEQNRVQPGTRDGLVDWVRYWSVRRVADRTAACLAGRSRQQVLQLVRALWSAQCPACVGASLVLAVTGRETGHPGLSGPALRRGLSSIVLYDAGR